MRNIFEWFDAENKFVAIFEGKEIQTARRLVCLASMNSKFLACLINNITSSHFKSMKSFITNFSMLERLTHSMMCHNIYKFTSIETLKIRQASQSMGQHTQMAFYLYRITSTDSAMSLCLIQQLSSI